MSARHIGDDLRAFFLHNVVPALVVTLWPLQHRMGSYFPWESELIEEWSTGGGASLT